MTLANPQPTRTGLRAWWNDLSRGMKAIVIIAIVTAVLWVAGQMNPSPPIQTTGPVPRGGTSAPADNRCQPAPQALLDAIEEGLEVSGGGSLRNGYTVNSNDYNNVWFVSADIQGSVLDGADDIGVWATNNLTAGSGLILAVDGFANQFSDWGDGRETDAELSITDDGAREAADCARG